MTSSDRWRHRYKARSVEGRDNEEACGGGGPWRGSSRRRRAGCNGGSPWGGSLMEVGAGQRGARGGQAGGGRGLRPWEASTFGIKKCGEEEENIRFDVSPGGQQLY
jgi:hypothetical protein